ncbi:erythroid differentiation-related factor 1 isoform X2 [Strongylocentrotus purpuratus]|uniref:Erythroid differentiation-related factor 1 n=1 Tax=Strongylocentrotus purpuratus TaxID=7668 RepID=A0A7M7SWI3_STRPU|nr:erythroid differentiation-related factor 1 isoform X2 [Strongylocentrotus purpuratus]
MSENMEGESDKDADDGPVKEESQGGDALVVKSKTEVRFPRVMQRLFPYSQLKPNTNLHQPPPNWLRNGPTIQVPNTWIRGEPADISSFGMADADIMDDVDVISASENIKKLLKIPFSNDQVSLAVHRIGKTLLLDKLDLYKHLRDASQSEQKWLKDVFMRLVQNDGENKFQSQHKTSENRQTSNLLSKFLYHSLGPGYNIEETEEGQIPELAKALQQLPAPPEDDVSQFARQVIWQFEDIRMLIGTDLPIFGGTTYPAVSLRLRDTQSPINVLTGLDYWLDNLMCNVPELVMCYHLDGFVQKYELIKTEEIPKLENAQFSQKVVKDIAQNILSFINSNCTKEGHTYWLFKGKNDDVVKLYDLSSLMTEHPECPWDNPFVVPVAMLLYRVAHNMAQADTISAKNKHIIVYLLNKCLYLLAQCRDQHLEIVAQANFILCRMFMEESRQSRHGNTGDDDGSDSAWNGSSTTSSDVEDETNDAVDDDQAKRPEIVLPPISIKNLTVPSSKTWKCKDIDNKRSKVKSLDASKAEKARQILEYVADGLKAIKSSIPETATGAHPAPASPPSHAAMSLSLPPSTPDRSPLPTSKAIPLRDKPRAADPRKAEPRTADQQSPSSISGREKGEQSSARGADGTMKQDLGQGSLFVGGDVAHDVKDVGGSVQRYADRKDTERSLETLVQEMDIGRGGDSNQVYSQSADESKARDEDSCETSSTGIPSDQLQLKDGPAGVEQCSDLVESDRSPGSRSKAVAKEKPFPPGSWQETSGLRLLEKAYQAYCILTALAWEEHKHGRALLMAQLAIKCHNASRSTHGGETNVYNVLMMCGDSYLLLTHDPSNQHLHHEDYQNISEMDTFILETAIIQQTSHEYEWATEFQTDTEDCLECSIKCYKACLGDEVKKAKAFKRGVGQKLGNACNELGVFFMNTAANLASVKESMPSTFEQELWKGSYRCFDTGVKSFEEVSDSTNVALLNCNMGRLMRLCAQSYASGGSMGPDAEFSTKEKHYYLKAAECYARGLHILGNKSGHVALWDSITWELCSTYFNMACLLQDQPPVSTSNLAEVEKDVLEFMSKALTLCDTEETSSSRQPLYQYRAATIHHRLASMYHNSIRNQSSHMKKKHTKTLAELHYTKAVKLFKEMDRPVELLRVELERVALLEHQFENQTGKGPKVKTLESALGIILDCSSVIHQLEKLSYKIVAKTADTEDLSKKDIVASNEGDAGGRRHQKAMKGDNKQDFPRTGQRKQDSGSCRDDVKQKQPKGSDESVEDVKLDVRLSTERHGDGSSDVRRLDVGQEQATTAEDATSEKETDGSKTMEEQGHGADGDPAREGAGADGDPAREGAGAEAQGAVGGASGGNDDGAVEGTVGEEDVAAGTKSEVDEVKRLLTIFESRLQYVLLHLVKFMSGGKQR